MNTKQHEKIIHKELGYLIIQGCCFDIRKEYGPGQKESVYVNLLEECLELKGLKIENEKSIPIYSSKSGKKVGSYRPDLIVKDCLPIEVKSSRFTTHGDEKQLYHHLRNSKYELGYLVNFSSRRLFIKRIIYTNDRKPFLKLLSCIFVFCFVWFSVFAFSARAAEISFHSQAQEMAVGQQFQVSIMLNTNSEAINAVEGRVVFPGDLLSLKDIRDANSIVNFWVEKPRIDSGGRIAFSGIIPGGYQGQSGLLLTLIFVSKKEGQGTIELQEAKTLLNDGNGTEAALTVSPYQFTISQTINVSSEPPVIDKESPESFVPEIARDQTLFDGKWFLAFATQDKGSGIDHYEVKETRQWVRFENWLPFVKYLRRHSWIRAESPYILQDQELRSYVFVKAIDKAGNARVMKILPQNPLRWYENYENWIMIIVGFAVAYAVLRKKIESRK